MTNATMNSEVPFHARPVASAGAPKMRLTARGKRVVTVLVVAPLLAVIVGIGMLLNAEGLGSAANANSTESTATFEYITVSNGESMWDIALSVAPKSDPRDVIVDLKRFNALQSSTVLPGQSLAIPPQYLTAGN